MMIWEAQNGETYRQVDLEEICPPMVTRAGDCKAVHPIHWIRVGDTPPTKPDYYLVTWDYPEMGRYDQQYAVVYFDSFGFWLVSARTKITHWAHITEPEE